jgi:hypothetical protein
MQGMNASGIELQGLIENLSLVLDFCYVAQCFNLGDSESGSSAGNLVNVVGRLDFL